MFCLYSLGIQLFAVRHRGGKDSHLSPGSIWIPAAGEQLSHRTEGLQHLLNHLQAQAAVGSCDQHVDWFRCHFPLPQFAHGSLRALIKHLLNV